MPTDDIGLTFMELLRLVVAVCFIGLALYVGIKLGIKRESFAWGGIGFMIVAAVGCAFLEMLEFGPFFAFAPILRILQKKSSRR